MAIISESLVKFKTESDNCRQRGKLPSRKIRFLKIPTTSQLQDVGQFG